MLKRFQPQLAWLVTLLLLTLLLAACGGAAQPVPVQTEEAVAAATSGDESCSTGSSCGPTQTEEAAAPVTTQPETQKPTSTIEATEAAPPTEAAAPAETSAPAAASKAICQPVEIPSNSLIAPVSDQDWAKGPANAPVTLIEYGDFQ